MEDPRVSVLMTVYNAAPYLRESIDSLIAQTCPHWELIAIENGSTDASAAILAGYKDPRIRVFALPQNILRAPALVFAFNQAKGPYMAILDADDVAYPQRFSREVEFLDNHPETVLVGSWFELIDKNSRVFGNRQPSTNPNELLQSLGWRNPMGHSSVMFRHEAAEAVGGYRPEYVCCHDYGFILAMAKYGQVAVIGEYLAKIRIFSGSMTKVSKHAINVATDVLSLFQYARENLPLARKTLWRNRSSVSKFEFYYGYALFFQGRIWLGLRKMVWGFFSFIVLTIISFLIY